MGNDWGKYGERLGSVWEASGKRLMIVWEASRAVQAVVQPSGGFVTLYFALK